MTVRLNFLRRSWTPGSLGEFVVKLIFILDLFSLKIIHNVRVYEPLRDSKRFVVELPQTNQVDQHSQTRCQQ
jgi:hypothetical protein